jgi:hypothetical protein
MANECWRNRISFTIAIFGVQLVEQQLLALHLLLRGRVEPGIVDGNGSVRGDRDRDVLGILREDARPIMPEEQPADDFAGPGDDRHGKVAHNRQVPFGHALEGSIDSSKNNLPPAYDSAVTLMPAWRSMSVALRYSFSTMCRTSRPNSSGRPARGG